MCPSTAIRASFPAFFPISRATRLSSAAASGLTVALSKSKSTSASMLNAIEPSPSSTSLLPTSYAFSSAAGISTAGTSTAGTSTAGTSTAGRHSFCLLQAPGRTMNGLITKGLMMNGLMMKGRITNGTMLPRFGLTWHTSGVETPWACLASARLPSALTGSSLIPPAFTPGISTGGISTAGIDTGGIDAAPRQPPGAGAISVHWAGMCTAGMSTPGMVTAGMVVPPTFASGMTTGSACTAGLSTAGMSSPFGQCVGSGPVGVAEGLPVVSPACAGLVTVPAEPVAAGVWRSSPPPPVVPTPHAASTIASSGVTSRVLVMIKSPTRIA